MKLEKDSLDRILLSRVATKVPGVFLIRPKDERNPPILLTEGKQFSICSLYIIHNTFGREEIINMENISCYIGLMRLDFGKGKHSDFVAIYKHDLNAIATSSNPLLSMELVCIAARDIPGDKFIPFGVRASFKEPKSADRSIWDLERKAEDGILAYSKDPHIVRLWQEDIWAYEEVWKRIETSRTKIEEQPSRYPRQYDETPATASKTDDESADPETISTTTFDEIIREE